MGTVATVKAAAIGTGQAEARLSLIFASGERPAASDVERALSSLASEAQGDDGKTRTLGGIVDGGDAARGWLELLASGLTFDLTGLSPALGGELPPLEHRFGLPAGFDADGLEAVGLMPGPHLSGGHAMLPVVRTMLGLAASLVRHLPARAVCWHPARSWIEPAYFTRIVEGWLAGGVFPALGLTAVRKRGEGVESIGLSFFTGQEVLVDAASGEAPAETVKLAVRIIDYIVRHGPLQSLDALKGPQGETLLAEPGADGRIVRVRRGA